MANLGNGWHLPSNPEPLGNAGMRDPVFPTDPVAAITVFSGSQFQGDGNPGNQLQDGSAVLFKQATDTAWQTVPLIFTTAIDNNKYYSAAIPVGTFPAGTVVQYYLRIAYDDHATTFLQAAPGDMLCITTGDESAAQAAPFTFTIETPDKRGQWGEPFTLPNVGIHAHVLPTGLVLMWGRRDNPQQSLDTDPASPLAPGLPPAPPATCTPFLWNPANGDTTPTPAPTLADGATNANLFCSGHAFLPDGRLLVAGGHLADSHGLSQAAIYDSAANTWTPTATMNDGRWYPTAITLPTGSVLVLSGSFFNPAQAPSVANNVVPQVWSNGNFTSVAPIPDAAFDLFPRTHVASSGLIYMTSLVQTWSLDISGTGTWAAPPNVTRQNGLCDYAPSVLYDVDKVLFVGGGNPPTANAQTIDLSQAQLAWQTTGAMNFPRRQHNATILPDGTVLVTGGTRGGGDPGTAAAFNDLDPGQPVHIAELWDPKTGQWTELAAEKTDRCYHSTAVLLPDGRVLSAGSGEFILNEGTPQQVENDPQDSHTDAQLFSPPYLFKGPQPEITSAPGFGSVRRHVRDRYRSAGRDRHHQPDPPVFCDPLIQRQPAHQLPPSSGPGRKPQGNRTAQCECLPTRVLPAVHPEQSGRAVGREDRPDLGARWSRGPGTRGRTARRSCRQCAGLGARCSQGCLCPTGHGAGRGQRYPGRSRDHGDLPIRHRGLLGGCERGAPQPGGSGVCRPDPRWGQINSDYLPGRRSAARAGSLERAVPPDGPRHLPDARGRGQPQGHRGSAG